MLKNINKNKIILAIIILIVVLVIPLTIVQVQQQQEIRQRAQQGQPHEPTPYLRFNLRTNSVYIGQTLDVDLWLINETGHDVSSLELTIPTSFNDIFTVENFEANQESGFETLIYEYSPSTGFHYVGLNLSRKPIKEQNTTLGKLTLRASNEGTVVIDPNKLLNPAITSSLKKDDFLSPSYRQDYAISTYRSEKPFVQAAPTIEPTAPTVGPITTPTVVSAKDKKEYCEKYLDKYASFLVCFGKTTDTAQCTNIDYIKNNKIDGDDYKEFLSRVSKSCNLVTPATDPNLPPRHNFVCTENFYRGPGGCAGTLTSIKHYTYSSTNISAKCNNETKEAIFCTPLPEEEKPPQPASR